MQTTAPKTNSQASAAGVEFSKLRQAGPVSDSLDAAHWQIATWLEVAQQNQTPEQIHQSTSTENVPTRQFRRFDQPAKQSEPSGLAWSDSIGMEAPEASSPPVYLVNAEYDPSTAYEIAVSRTNRGLNASQSESDSPEIQQQYRKLISEAAHDVRSPIATASQLISTVAQRMRGLGNVTKAELSLLDIANQRLAQASNWAAGILVDRRLEQLSAVSIRKRFYPQQWQALMQPLLNSIAKDHNVRLLWIGWERSLPRMYLDVNHLSRAVLNLVTNAIQASSAGGQIVLRIQHQAKNNSRIEIQVEDRGRGLPEELLQLVNSSGAMRSATKGQMASPGIGLSTSRALVASLGGSLSAKNVSPQGTKFSLTIPVDDLRVGIRSWILRQSERQAGGVCAAYGIRIGPQVNAQQIDQKLQLLSSSREMAYRIGSDRWLYFSTHGQQTVAKLDSLSNEYQECFGLKPFRFVQIAREKLPAALRSNKDNNILANVTESFYKACTKALGDIIPLLDNLDADFGHLYNESLLRNKQSTRIYRRQDKPEGNHLRSKFAGDQRAASYERNPDGSPQLADSHITQELNDLAHGWKRTQERLDKAHRH
ncbi:MAG: sensor histidine kinase [Planctomycetota bacterium]